MNKKKLNDASNIETFTIDKNIIEKPYTTCPDCGKPISTINDGGNGFCVDCAPNH